MTGRPSTFLHELRDTASKIGVGEDLVRHKMIKSLPPSIGAVLAAQRDLTLTQLGQLADKLVPLMQSACMMAQPCGDRRTRGRSPSPTVRYEPRRTSHSSDDRDAHAPRQSDTGTRYRSRQYSPYPDHRDDKSAELRPFRDGQGPKVCRAHIYFGIEARTCRPWCQWPDKINAKVKPSSRSSSPRPYQSEN